MKIQNDFECRPISSGHIYETRNRTGWMTVTNFELANGLFINLMHADVGTITNRDQVDEMNFLGLPLITSGAAEMSYDDGTSYSYVQGTAVFGRPLNKKLKMVVNSRRMDGISIIYSPDTKIPVYDSDPDIPTMLHELAERLGTGMDRTIEPPLEVKVISESVLLELESNRCRNTGYIGKRASQMLHVLYNAPDPGWVDIRDVRDNAAVDRICLKLTEDYSMHRSVKDVCAEEGVDEFWFINNFKKRYGRSPTEHVVLYKHIHAAALILTEKYTVREVMSMVGYSSMSMFLKAFRKVHGCNPTDYVDSFDRMIEAYPEKL